MKSILTIDNIHKRLIDFYFLWLKISKFEKSDIHCELYSNSFFFELMIPQRILQKDNAFLILKNYNASGTKYFRSWVSYRNSGCLELVNQSFIQQYFQEILEYNLDIVRTLIAYEKKQKTIKICMFLLILVVLLLYFIVHNTILTF